jgi:hypothetical protein
MPHYPYFSFHDLRNEKQTINFIHIKNLLSTNVVTISSLYFISSAHAAIFLISKELNSFKSVKAYNISIFN